MDGEEVCVKLASWDEQDCHWFVAWHCLFRGCTNLQANPATNIQKVKWAGMPSFLQGLLTLFMLRYLSFARKAIIRFKNWILAKISIAMSWVAHFLDTHSDTPLEPSVLAKALEKVFCKKNRFQCLPDFPLVFCHSYLRKFLGSSQFSSREDKEWKDFSLKILMILPILMWVFSRYYPIHNHITNIS